MILWGLQRALDAAKGKVFAIGYGVTALVTFGHAWTHIYDINEFTGRPKGPDSPIHIMGSLAGGAAWPLYWAAGIAEQVWGKAGPPITIKSADGLCTATSTKTGMGVSLSLTPMGNERYNQAAIEQQANAMMEEASERARDLQK